MEIIAYIFIGLVGLIVFFLVLSLIGSFIEYLKAKTNMLKLISVILIGINNETDKQNKAVDEIKQFLNNSKN
jgi:hypothetical protein